MAHKLITKIVQHTKNIYIFVDLTKKRKIGIILIHSHRIVIVVLAVLIFLFDNLMEERPLALTS